MWEARTESLSAGKIQKVSILKHDQCLLYSQVAELWQQDHAFRTFFISLLSNTPYLAYLWETPPVTADTFDRNFEFIIADNQQLSHARPDQRAFGSYFDSADTNQEIVSFPNLGGDALLIAPCPLAPSSRYAHLGEFCQEAPASQQQALWKAVGTALANQLNDQPTWLSTSGLGIFWLHVRLDSTPKYYSYRPYMDAI